MKLDATEKIIQRTFKFTVLQVVLVSDILCIQLIMHCKINDYEGSRTLHKNCMLSCKNY